MLIKRIPDVSGLVTTTFLNTKVKEFDNKIRDFSGLLTKTDYDAKISEIEARYITASDYDKFTSDILNVRINQK